MLKRCVKKKRPSYTCLLIIHAAGSAWTCSYGHLLTGLYEGRHSGHFSKGDFCLCSGYGLFGCVCLSYWLYCYQFHVKCFICSIITLIVHSAWVFFFCACCLRFYNIKNVVWNCPGCLSMLLSVWEKSVLVNSILHLLALYVHDLNLCYVNLELY